jgi:hypothetical protein
MYFVVTRIIQIVFISKNYLSIILSYIFTDKAYAKNRALLITYEND